MVTSASSVSTCAAPNVTKPSWFMLVGYGLPGSTGKRAIGGGPANEVGGTVSFRRMRAAFRKCWYR